MADVVKLGEALRKVRPDLFGSYSPREIGRALRDARPDAFGNLEDVKGPSRELIGRSLPKPPAPQPEPARTAPPVLPPSPPSAPPVLPPSPSGLPTAEQIDQATQAEAQQFVQGVKLGARIGAAQQAPPVPKPRVTLRKSMAGNVVDVAGAAKDIGRSLFTPAGIAESFAEGERQLSRGVRNFTRGQRRLGDRLPNPDPTGERIGPPAPFFSDSRAKAATDILQGAGGMSSVVAAPAIIGGGLTAVAKGGAKAAAKFGGTVAAGFAADPVVRGVTERGARAVGATDDQAELAGEIASFGVEPAAIIAGVKSAAKGKKPAPSATPPPKVKPRVRTAPDIEAKRAEFQERVRTAREDITPARTKEERRAKLAKGMGQAEPIPSDPLPANLEPIAKEMGLDPEKVTREERGVLAEMFREREAATQAEAERPRREFEAKQEAADRRARNEQARTFAADVEERKREKRVESAKAAAPGDVVSFGEDVGEVVRVNQRTLTVRDASGNERRIPFEAVEEVAKPKAKLGEQTAKLTVQLKGAQPAETSVRPSVEQPAPADAAAPGLAFDKPLEGPAPVAPVQSSDGQGRKPAAKPAGAPPLFAGPRPEPVGDAGGRGLDARTPRSERQPVLESPAQAEQQVIPPAPVPAQAAPTAGRTSRAKTRSHTIDTRLELIEGDDLIASSLDDLSENRAFDQGLQPRSTESSNTEQRISNIIAPNGDSSKFDPERLADALEAQVGAPIIARNDNMVESGNARVLALRRIFRRFPEAAKRYRQYLIDNAESLGIDPEGVRKAKAPILVRRRLTDLTREQRLEFVNEANESPVNQMNAADSARLDSERLTPKLLGKLRADKNYAHAENADFVREFLESVPPTERGVLIDGGKLTGQGYARIEAAVLAKAYGDTPTVRNIINESGEDFRNLSKAMQEAAPRVAELQNKVAAGERFDVGIADELADAAATLERLRNQRMTVDQYVNDQGRLGLSVAPAEPTLNDRILLAIDTHKRAPKRIAGILTRYADLVDAAGDPRQGSMFGQAEPPNRSELWNTARRQEERAWAENEIAKLDNKITAAVEKHGVVSEAALLAKHPDPLKPSERSKLARFRSFLDDLESGKPIDEATRRFEDAQQDATNPLFAGEEGQAGKGTPGDGSVPDAKAGGDPPQQAPAAPEVKADTAKPKLAAPTPAKTPGQPGKKARGTPAKTPPVETYEPPYDVREAMDAKAHRQPRATVEYRSPAAPVLGKPEQPPKYLLTVEGVTRKSFDTFAEAAAAADAANHRIYNTGAELVRTDSGQATIRRSAEGVEVQIGMMRQKLEPGEIPAGADAAEIARLAAKKHAGLMLGAFFGDPERGAVQIARRGQERAAVLAPGQPNVRPTLGQNLRQRVGDIAAALKAARQKVDIQAARAQLIDRTAPIQDFLKAARSKGIGAEKDAGILARTFAGVFGAVENKLDFLDDILAPVRADYQDVVELAMFDRFDELARRGVTQFPDGMTPLEVLAQKRALHQRLSANPERYRRIQTALQNVRAYQGRILSQLRDEGIISDHAYQKIRANNRSYIPLQRVGFLADDLNNKERGFLPRRFSVATQDVVKELTGSQREIIDPLESIVRNTYKAEHVIRRNRVARAMADLQKNPDYAGLVQPLTRHQDAPEGMVKLAYFENGQVKYFAVPTVVGKAMQGLGVHQADLITKAASIGSGALRAGATGLNVAFIPANALRDFQTLGVTQGTGLIETAATWAHGLAEVAGKGRYFREWKDAGGAFSGYFETLKGAQRTAEQLRRGKVERVIRTARNPFELIRHASEIIEQAPRVGAYKRARTKLGESPTAAAYTSRNATVDFARSGSALAIVNQWVPFLNARLQGNLNIFKSFREHPGRTMLASGSLIIAPTLATYYWNKTQFPEVEQDIQPWEREGHFHLILGDKKDADDRYTQVIKIPKGEVGRVMGNTLEAFLDYVAGRDSATWQQLGLQILSDVSPLSFERDGKFSGLRLLSDVLPPTVKAFSEVQTNLSFFTGRAIVPRNLEDASPGEQYKNDTPAAAVWLGEKLNISPLKIQAFVRSQFGGIGEQVTNLLSGSESGAGRTVSRRFVGAAGGYGEEQAFRALDEMKAQTEDMRVRAERDALRILDGAKAKPTAERLAYLKGELGGIYKADPQHAARVWDELKYEAVKDQLTPFERALKASPVSVRAEMIAQQARQLPPQQRGEYVRRLEAARILTDSVLDALAKQAQPQQQRAGIAR